jgi:hypothetical protein
MIDGGRILFNAPKKKSKLPRKCTTGTRDCHVECHVIQFKTFDKYNYEYMTLKRTQDCRVTVSQWRAQARHSSCPLAAAAVIISDTRSVTVTVT